MWRSHKHFNCVEVPPWEKCWVLGNHLVSFPRMLSISLLTLVYHLFQEPLCFLSQSPALIFSHTSVASGCEMVNGNFLDYILHGFTEDLLWCSWFCSVVKRPLFLFCVQPGNHFFFPLPKWTETTLLLPPLRKCSRNKSKGPQIREHCCSIK